MHPARNFRARFDHLELDETGHFAREDRLRSVDPVTLPSPADSNAPVGHLRARFDHFDPDGSDEFAHEDYPPSVRLVTWPSLSDNSDPI